jgi:hypothetical protein
MAAGTVYLDVDDEITSAAARIRSSESTKVGLVVPYGSRISTSRMNFRLLSREAVVNNRRLSIIAGDPATRALAASAGLPVFATVGEYESALAGPPAAADDADDLGLAAAGGTPSTDETPPPTPRKRGTRKTALEAETQALFVPAAEVAAVASAASTRPVPATPMPAPDLRPDASGSSGRLPVRGAARQFRIRTPVLVGAAAVVLALAVVAIGAYLVLPAADITVTPREEAIGPISLVVTADPDATAVDAANDVVPAVRLEVPIDVSETFTTTGKRVEQTAARGTVTFTSENTFIAVTVPRGTRVGTTSGIAFTTNVTVVLPKASFATGPSHRDVGITAVKPGPAGNVEAGTITERPTDTRQLLVSVNNSDPTAGGARNEFPKVSQDEVDKAVAGLRAKLDEAFTAAVAAGAGAPAETTLFPETAALGDSTSSIDPATLVGQEIETFDLSLNATGTVIAVDASPVKDIARTRLVGNVGAGYSLVEGSTKIEQGDPLVSDGVVSFPVSARAARVRILDPDDLRALVKGQPTEQARTLLEPFGEVSIETWPAWVSSITGFDSRLTVKVGGPSEAGPGPSPSPGRPSTSARPSTAPSGSSAVSAPSAAP